MTGFQWSAAHVGEALGVEIPSDLPCSSISTDTRTLEKGDVFVALSGDDFDGHSFLQAARDAGASVAVVRGGTPLINGLHLVPVDDTRLAYAALAAHRRHHFDGPVIAITGSNGKTSTKEMVAAALGTRWKVHATAGNNNNTVGVPLTVLTAPQDTEALVVEVGASEPGEVARLRDVVNADVAIVTNVYAAHLEGFGSLENVLAEKLELTRDTPVAFVGTAPTVLKERAALLARTVFSVGLGSADVEPDSYDVRNGLVRARFHGVVLDVPLPGEHQAGNAMFALAVARHFELDLASAARSIADASFPTGRMQVMQVGRLTILNDSYNANPASVRAALATVGTLRDGRSIVLILGSMLELGEESERLHREMLGEALDTRPDVIVAVGEFAAVARAAALEGPFIFAEAAGDVARLLRPHLKGEELILLKGSRGVHLEKVITDLETGAP